jgi:hypothetical protein
MTALPLRRQQWQAKSRGGVDAGSRADAGFPAGGKSVTGPRLAHDACVRVRAHEGAGKRNGAARAYGSGNNCCHSCQEAESLMGCGFRRQGFAESDLPPLARAEVGT